MTLDAITGGGAVFTGSVCSVVGRLLAHDPKWKAGSQLIAFVVIIAVCLIYGNCVSAVRTIAVSCG